MSSKCLDKTQISMCDAVLLEIWEKIAELVIHTIPTEQALANAQQQPLFYPLYVSRRCYQQWRCRRRECSADDVRRFYVVTIVGFSSLPSSRSLDRFGKASP
jgi:hypothetical protein